MFVYPPTPLVKVVRSTLLCDALERPHANAVVKRDGNGSFLSSFGVRVLQNHVVAPRSVVPVAEFLKNGDYFLT